MLNIIMRMREKHGDWRMHKKLILCKYFSAEVSLDFFLMNFVHKFPLL